VSARSHIRGKSKTENTECVKEPVYLFFIINLYYNSERLHEGESTTERLVGRMQKVNGVKKVCAILFLN